MFRIRKGKKGIAVFFLSLLILQNFFPVVAFALTSGPSQPEMQKFQPAGASDMVDLFSGDFKYDIPLLDVGGYPVNLSYHSGGGMEDEASWVGTNWSLNPGVVNRTMRGIPDDFTGDKAAGDQPDIITSISHRKPFKKIGAQLVLKPTAFGWEFGSASLHLGVYKDNYYGIGGEVGASLSFNLAQMDNTTLTAGLDLNSDTREGVSVSPSLSLSAKCDDDKELSGGGLSGGFTYNSRAGLQSINLSQSAGFKTISSGSEMGPVNTSMASFTKYFGQTYTPSISSSTSSTKYSFNLDGGLMLFGVYVGIGGSGYVSSEDILDDHTSNPAYGYMNYSQGTKNPDAMLDFNREKDDVFFPTAPAIPIPVATEDYFEAVSQAGAEQFRPFYSGNYTVYDRTFTKTSGSLGGGLTLGWGNLVQGGARIDLSSDLASTHKWVTKNYYLSSIARPLSPDPTHPLVETNYFKKTGEHAAMDMDYYSLIGKDVTERAAITGKLFPNISDGATANNILLSSSGQRTGTTIQRSNRRDIRTSAFSYLTGGQAKVYGLDKMINSTSNDASSNATFQRVDQNHKAHHISEVTVTDKEGKRMVYGIPVYNTDQEEVSFSVPAPSTNYVPNNLNYPNNPNNFSPFDYGRRTGLVTYTTGADNTEGNSNGRENIYNRKIIPPYATSYLLTGILSPDYVDRTGDGITDDDLGTAVKFGYTKMPNLYKWRAPYETNMANYNEGFLSDPNDDKASYVYGQKELWYMQSISSKTMIAQFFTSKRVDAVGVIGENGGMDPDPANLLLQKLDSIRLFSKADLLKNGVNALPIKVVHFEYDYSLYPGVANNLGNLVANTYDPSSSSIDLNVQKGKLTLKKVYFTFGTSSRGQSNPYIFNYDTRLIRDGSIANLPAQTNQDVNEVADKYTQRQSDRWGNYKQSFYNPQSGGTQALNNSEFPYSLQVTDQGAYDERQLADRFASKWQLTSITTPTGGIISVEYESDDYAYVQDRKAMVMCPLAGVGAKGQASGMNNASKLYVKLPVAVADVNDFKNTYLDGPNSQTWNNIFYKIFTDIDDRGHNEYVYGYAEIDPNGVFDIDPSDSHIVGIPLKLLNNYNPVSKEAWQTIKANLPQYAYENYDNSDVNSVSGDVKAAIISIVQAFVNLRELFQSFDKTASNKHYADKVDLSKSMIRLDYPVGKMNGGIVSGGSVVKNTYGKLGGGSRVRKVEISDDWQTMSGVSNTNMAVYGLQYDYTITNDKGVPMSSGVASYEPQIGNEENPFHEPVPYTEKVEWGSDRYHHIEKPFGESFFPAPAVGYSRVTTTAYGVDNSVMGAPPATHTNSGYTVNENTGYTVNEFYTARDFPTQVDYLPLDQENYQNNLVLLLFASSFVDRVATSQGFKVTLNDMHGKQKSVKIFDKGNALISSSEYFYNVVDNNAQQKQLNNTVLAIDKDGNIPAGGVLIGTDAELVTDVRESTTNSSGTSAAGYGGATWLGIFPMGFGGGSFNHTSTIKSYNSISSVKVIHQYGILKSVKTTQKGSSITVQNLLWDGRTGDVLLTQNQNEFNDYTYVFHYPAYMAYEGMGSAYFNSGTVFTGFQSNPDGTIQSPLTNLNPTPDNPACLFPGDELVQIDPGTSTKGWIIRSADNSLRFIDQSGNFIAASGTFMVTRTGRRNFLDASAGTVVSRNNPLILTNGSYQLQLGVDRQILDAKAIKYKDEWEIPVPQQYVPVPYEDPQTDCISEVFWNSLSPILSRIGGFRRALFAIQSDGKNCDFFLPLCNELPPKCDICNTTGGFLNGQPASNFPFYQENAHIVHSGVYNSYLLLPGDVAHVGDYRIVFDQVDDAFNMFINSNTDILADLYTFISNSDQSVNVPKYCLVKESPGHWLFRRANSLNLTNCTNLPDINCEVARNPCVDYTDLVRFHIVGKTLTKYVCQDPLNQIINPYYLGVKGNWQPYTNYAYQVNRVQIPGLAGQNGGTNIRTSGYYSEFSPFWIYSNRSLAVNTPMPTGFESAPLDPRWVWASQPVFYDQKGNEVESVDALMRYSSALFGYRQSVATAVAANARENEIAFEGFEDYNFGLEGSLNEACPPLRHLDFGLLPSGNTFCNSGNCLVSDQVHSGNYSLQLSSPITITAPGGNKDPNLHFLDFDPTGRYVLLGNEQATGFAPVSGKKYLLSLWVNESVSQTDPHPNYIRNLQVSINNNAMDFSNSAMPLVEGWKKLDLIFTAGSSFNLQLTPLSSIYIDDIRILPFDGQLKSYVYDDRTMRLMAQLDENNFGIFYEYDDEGTPIRVKKETEKGVMTIKENRQSYRQIKKQ